MSRHYKFTWEQRRQTPSPTIDISIVKRLAGEALEQVPSMLETADTYDLMRSRGQLERHLFDLSSSGNEEEIGELKNRLQRLLVDVNSKVQDHLRVEIEALSHPYDITQLIRKYENDLQLVETEEIEQWLSNLTQSYTEYQSSRYNAILQNKMRMDHMRIGFTYSNAISSLERELRRRQN